MKKAYIILAILMLVPVISLAETPLSGQFCNGAEFDAFTQNIQPHHSVLGWLVYPSSYDGDLQYTISEVNTILSEACGSVAGTKFGVTHMCIYYGYSKNIGNYSVACDPQPGGFHSENCGCSDIFTCAKPIEADEEPAWARGRLLTLWSMQIDSHYANGVADNQYIIPYGISRTNVGSSTVSFKDFTSAQTAGHCFSYNYYKAPSGSITGPAVGNPDWSLVVFSFFDWIDSIIKSILH